MPGSAAVARDSRGPSRRCGRPGRVPARAAGPRGGPGVPAGPRAAVRPARDDRPAGARDRPPDHRPHHHRRPQHPFPGARAVPALRRPGRDTAGARSARGVPRRAGRAARSRRLSTVDGALAQPGRRPAAGSVAAGGFRRCRCPGTPRGTAHRMARGTAARRAGRPDRGRPAGRRIHRIAGAAVPDAVQRAGGPLDGRHRTVPPRRVHRVELGDPCGRRPTGVGTGGRVPPAHRRGRRGRRGQRPGRATPPGAAGAAHRPLRPARRVHRSAGPVEPAAATGRHARSLAHLYPRRRTGLHRHRRG